MPWRTFLVYNVAGAIIWAVAITILGYLFGNSWPLLEKWVGRSGLFMLLGAVIALVVIHRLRASRKEREAESKV